MNFDTYIELRKKAFLLVKETSGDEMRYYSPIENQPYWTHLMNVHNFLITMAVDDYEILLAAILHDIVEDSNITIDQIEKEYSKRVAKIVHLTTKPNEYVPKDFYNKVLKSKELGAKMIKVADRIDNMLTNYCYSEKAISTDKYLKETEDYFEPIALQIGWLRPLQSAIDYYKKHLML